MHIRSISWLGIRTNAFPEMVGFFRDVLEVELEYESPEIMSFMLRNGDLVEIIGPGDRRHDDFPLTPVPGFFVDNVDRVREQLVSRGVEFMGRTRKTQEGWAYALLRAPDGNIFRIMRPPTSL
jgi:predicted enzyme related to lactoylglutathione lyase